MFSPGRSVRDSQELAQQQHHDFPSQQGDSSWRWNSYSNNEDDGGFGSYSPTITGSGTRPAHGILSNNCDYDSPSSFGPYSRHDTLDSYKSSRTSYSLPSNTGSGCINPQLTQFGIPSEFQCQTYLTDMPPVASPDPTLSPALFLCQGGSPAQAAGYGTNQPSGYFGTYPNYQQAPIVPQERGVYQNPGIGGPMPSHPPDQPTHHDVKPDTVADSQIPILYVCHECGKGCKRQTDLDRHLKTTKRHGDPSGPACPESDCKYYTRRFSRPDNFKAHYKKRHGNGDEEADEFIQQWRAQINPGFPTGVSGRVWDNDGGRKRC